MQTADLSADFTSSHNTRTPWYVAHKRWYPGLLLMLLAVIASLPALRGGYVLDDDIYVTQNSTLRTADGLRQAWVEMGAEPDYYPVLYSTFWAEYHLWRLNPLAYHAVNLGLHALAVLLLWRLLVRLRVPGAWLAAALFAIHPVCVETTAWVAETKNTLSMSLVLAAMLYYLRFDPVDGNSSGESIAAKTFQHSWRWYACAMVLFLAALLAKSAVVATPVVLLLIYWWKGERLGWKIVVRLTPIFTLALLVGALTIWIETHFNRANETDFYSSTWDRLLIASRAVWFYAGKLVWPHPLMFVYPKWNVDAGQWLQYFPLVAIVFLFALLWKTRNTIGRGPLAAALIFIVTLLPAIGLFNACYLRYCFVADHLVYQASAALFALAAASVAIFVERRRHKFTHDTLRRGAPIFAGAILLVCLGLSWNQSLLYRDPITLYGDTLAKNPDAWIAHHNLALALVDAGRAQEAVEHFQQAIQLRPNFPEAENNLGNALMSIGKFDDARQHYEQALKLRSDDSDIFDNLGNANRQLGKFEDAIECYQKALALNPRSVQAHSNFGSMLRQCGRLAEAIKQYEAALAIEPNLSVLHNNLANTLVVAGRVPEAIQHYQTAIHLEHDYVDAYLNLASTYARGKQMDAALATADKALAIANANGQIQQAQKIEAWMVACRSRHIDPNVAPASATKSDPLFKY